MKKKRKNPILLKAVLRMLLAALLVFIALKYIDARVMPSVKRVMELHAVGKTTKTIDNAVKEVIQKADITSQDMYTKTTDGEGRLTSLSANTVLINTICSDVAEQAIDNLLNLEDERVYLPLGIVTGVDFLSTKGPEVFEISLRQLGDCTVEYETSFVSEGINQVNYQIWLLVESNIGVVNPFTSQNIIVKRKVPIVNTYISGEVPNSIMYPFLNKQTPD